MTTMPKTKVDLKARINWSIQSSLAKTNSKKPASFLMVLELNNEILGISAIYTKVAQRKPSVFFKIRSKEISSKTLNFQKKVELLQLYNCNSPYTELGTLFLSPSARAKGVGKLLSLSRLCYMALDPNRFDRKTFVEIRGWKNDKGESDFWNNFSKIFFELDFDGADSLSYIDNHFISEAVPSFPFLKELIHPKAKRVIGKAHQNAFPAQKILEQQGFHSNGLVDVFDAGPCLEAFTKRINIVRNQIKSKAKIVKSLSYPSSGYLSNCSLNNFRCTFSDFLFSDGTTEITQETARILKVRSGDFLSVFS